MKKSNVDDFMVYESSLLSSSEGDMNLCHMPPLMRLKGCQEESVNFLELATLGSQGKQK